MGSLVIGPTTVRRFPWKTVLQIVGGALILALMAVRFFLVELVRVRGNYMAPTVMEGDFALVRHERTVGRGDVVVLDLGGQIVLRRVIGLPGDRVATQEGVFTLNELPVPTQVAGVFAWREPLLKGVRLFRQQLLVEELLPGRYVRTLGDHVGAGRPWTLEVPAVTVEADQFFVYCDNRRECPEDERRGIVPATAVVALAQSIAWYGDARVVPPAPLQGQTWPLTAGPLPPAEPSVAPSSPPVK